MQSEWFSDLGPEEQESMKKSVLSSKIVLDKLDKMLYNRSMKTQEVNSPDYDSPGWSHKQAHLNGKLEALREIRKLLEIQPARK